MILRLEMMLETYLLGVTGNRAREPLAIACWKNCKEK